MTVEPNGRVIREGAPSTVGAAEATDASTEQSPWVARLELRSPDPAVCPFIRGIQTSGLLTLPVDAPDAANRCAALREPVPQSLRQQELVCLTSSHVNCPRYLRGAVVVEKTVSRPGPRRPRVSVPALPRPRLPRPKLGVPGLPAIPRRRRTAGASDDDALPLPTPVATQLAASGRVAGRRTLRLPNVQLPELRAPALALRAVRRPVPGVRSAALRVGARLPRPDTGVLPRLRGRYGAAGTLTPAVFVSLLLLMAAFSSSVAFVVARGGISLPAAALAVEPSASARGVAVVPSGEPTVAPVASPTPTPVATPQPTPTPTPTPTPEPTPTPTPSPTPEPDPTPTPKPKPTRTPTPAGDPIVARFPELRRCPNRTDCYIYVVEPGNNLYSIARYYRVSYDRVLRMTPEIGDPATIRAGDIVRMPTPQRPQP